MSQPEPKKFRAVPKRFIVWVSCCQGYLGLRLGNHGDVRCANCGTVFVAP